MAASVNAPIDYLLHLADNALVLGQRNAEWCGHGPILEEDLALANNSLDLLGQARLLYQHAASLINADASAAQRFSHLQGARTDGAVTEDTLAYFRDTPEFRNLTLLELPHSGPLASTASGDRDYATTIARNFLYSALMVLVWDRLQASADAQLAAIAAKSLKEVRYHLRHASDWLVRFGDGTPARKRPSTTCCRTPRNSGSAARQKRWP
jgi:ring-1,2-phenylacetyl-CoA epoxidase subunit PaaC